MHTASRLASHRSFKLIVRFPGTDDPDVPVINIAQLQTHTQEEVSSSTSYPHPTQKTLSPDQGFTLPQHTISMDIITHRLFCFEQGNTISDPFLDLTPLPSPPPQIWHSQKLPEQKPAPPLKRGRVANTHSLLITITHSWMKQTSSHDNNYNGPSNTYSNNGHCLELWLPT